jgi:hypothetical protein
LKFTEIQTFEDLAHWSVRWANDEAAMHKFEKCMAQLCRQLESCGGLESVVFSATIGELFADTGESIHAYFFEFNDLIYTFPYHLQTGRFYDARYISPDLPGTNRLIQ